jgi:hypothetical protein
MVNGRAKAPTLRKAIARVVRMRPETVVLSERGASPMSKRGGKRDFVRQGSTA